MSDKFEPYIESYIREMGLERIIQKCFDEVPEPIIVAQIERSGGRINYPVRTPMPVQPYGEDTAPTPTRLPHVAFYMRGRAIMGDCDGRSMVLSVTPPNTDKRAEE